jgi:hypothetical protein
VYADRIGRSTLGPFEKDAHIAGVMHCSTGTGFPSAPVLFVTFDLLFRKHVSPP